MTQKIPCTIEVLTLNSEQSLGRCLESVQDFDDIIVLDGNSTDRTVEIAKHFGARIFPQIETTERNVRVEDFSVVRNRGVKEARYQWFTFVDSDEYFSPEAVEEIRQIVSCSPNPGEQDIRAYRRPRVYMLQGRKIERASTYPNYQLRLFYLPATRGFAKKVHEIMKLVPGTKVGTLKEAEYVPLPPIDETLHKWTRYLDIQQESLRNLTFRRLVNGVRSNLIKAAKYTLKFLFVRLFKRGKAMPFLYEYYNILYHVRLTYRLIENYFLKIFRQFTNTP